VTALEEIEVILSNKAKHRQLKEVSQTYKDAHRAFLLKRSQIEMSARETLELLPVSEEDVDTGLHFLGQNIGAALQLGDISHVSSEVDWLKGLLKAHGSAESQLTGFLQIYSQAVDQYMNGKGSPIVEWIDSEVEKLREKP
jgi:hypothetical protein